MSPAHRGQYGWKLGRYFSDLLSVAVELLEAFVRHTCILFSALGEVAQSVVLCWIFIPLNLFEGVPVNFHRLE